MRALLTLSSSEVLLPSRALAASSAEGQAAGHLLLPLLLILTRTAGFCLRAGRSRGEVLPESMELMLTELAGHTAQQSTRHSSVFRSQPLSC